MFAMNEPTTGLTIKNVAERTGVPVQTLRAWERRYGIPRPSRAPSNRYRVYSEHEIADVLWMKRQIEAGLTPGQASLLLREQHRPKATASASESPLATLKANFQAAALETDMIAAREILDEAFTLLTPAQVALQIIQPAMVEVGERWVPNELTVWQEHAASNLVRQKLLVVLQSQPPPLVSAPHLIAACAPAEEHELGLLVVTLLANRQGWQTTYLGQATPLEDLISLAHKRQPTAILVSVTTVIGLASLIPLLENETRPPTPLVFGGRLPNLLTSLREHLPGAYLGEDAGSILPSLGMTPPASARWSPSKPAWRAVLALRAQHLQIASLVVADLMPPRRPDAPVSARADQLSFATLYLLDALACALAFDVPELMEAHKEWLGAVMPARGVSAEALETHRKAVMRALQRALVDEADPFQSLLERLEETG